MHTSTPEMAKPLSEAEVHQRFEKFVQEEQANGLIDIKFALSGDGNGTVTDVMHQLLEIKAMKAAGQLQRYKD